MANRFKGEASATLDGETYTLSCDFNAMCDFQEATGKSAVAAFSDFESGELDFPMLREMVLAFLKKHHPEADKALAGDILSEDMDVLQRVLNAAMPDAAEGKETGNAKAAR